MTYYGRWPYKYEKAAELGAAGVLIIHDTKGAAYGWDVLRASWGNESFFLPDRHPRLLFEGWMGGETADRVLAAAKLDRKALRAAAETPDFAPVPLGLKATVRQHRDLPDGRGRQRRRDRPGQTPRRDGTDDRPLGPLRSLRKGRDARRGPDL